MDTTINKDSEKESLVIENKANDVNKDNVESVSINSSNKIQKESVDTRVESIISVLPTSMEKDLKENAHETVETVIKSMEKEVLHLEDKILETLESSIKSMEKDDSHLDETVQETVEIVMKLKEKDETIDTAIKSIDKDESHLEENAQSTVESNISVIPTSKEKDKSQLNSTPVASALTMLSQYDSDEDDNIEIVNVNEYRNRVIEVSSTSDSDSDSSVSIVEGETKSARSLRRFRKVIDKSIAIGSDDNDDEEDDDEIGNGGRKKSHRVPAKVKGEFLLEDLPPIEDLHITVPEDECIELGRVHSVVEQLLLVSVLPNSLLLDLDTVLFLDKGKRVLGAVFDVLGQVADPLYCIRFNSNEQIKEKNINIGDKVYVAPKTEHTQFIILSNLMKIRGSDASWENDIEPPSRYLDYSDDEQERQARARLRNRERNEPPENSLTEKRANLQKVNESSSDDDTMSVASQSTVATVRSRRSNGRGRGGRGRTFPSHSNQPQHIQQMPNYPSYDNSSWHSNLYPAPSYMYGQYPPLPPMGYYPPMPPYGYGPHPIMAYPPNVQHPNSSQNLWATPPPQINQRKTE